jgi:hypothetical protein
LINGSKRVIWKGLRKCYNSTKISTLTGMSKHPNLKQIAREKQKLRNKSAPYGGVHL